jgi:regulatory protein YycI of two-component signal transduction system YycFG
MVITTFTKIELPDINLFHKHIVGKHKGVKHAHKGNLTLTFEAQSGIAFYISKEAVDELTESVQEFLNEPVEAMIEDRIKQLHEYINKNILPHFKQKYRMTATSSSLTEIEFNHVSEGGEMGHAEAGMVVNCGSRMQYSAPQNT